MKRALRVLLVVLFPLLFALTLTQLSRATDWPPMGAPA